ncbi:MAG: hypothetical protein ABGX63_04105, partial [bacterium]
LMEQGEQLAEEVYKQLQGEVTEVTGMLADEQAIINYGTEFFANHKVSQPTFDEALKQFGAQYLVELTTLMGHYAQTSFYLNAFEAELPDNLTEPVLPV